MAFRASETWCSRGVGFIYLVLSLLGGYPGGINDDAIANLYQALNTIETSHHQTMPILVWRLVTAGLPMFAPVVTVFFFQNFIYWLGACLLVERGLQTTLRWKLLFLTMLYLPPLRGHLSLVSKDALGAGFFLLGSGLCVAQLKSRVFWSRMSGYLLLIFSSMVRPNMAFAVAALILGIQWQRRRVVQGLLYLPLAGLIIGTTLGLNFLLTGNAGRQSHDWYAKVNDLGRMSLDCSKNYLAMAYPDRTDITLENIQKRYSIHNGDGLFWYFIERRKRWLIPESLRHFYPQTLEKPIVDHSRLNGVWWEAVQECPQGMLAHKWDVWIGAMGFKKALFDFYFIGVSRNPFNHVDDPTFLREPHIAIGDWVKDANLHRPWILFLIAAILQLRARRKRNGDPVSEAFFWAGTLGALALFPLTVAASFRYVWVIDLAWFLSWFRYTQRQSPGQNTPPIIPKISGHRQR